MSDLDSPPYLAAEVSPPEPPSYTDVPELSHSYSLENKTHKWLHLFVECLGSKPPSLPVFREGQTISGRVDLDLLKPESLKGITIEVQAGTTAVGQEEIRFLELKKTLWTPSKGITKLDGKHSWPFNIQLPKEVVVSMAKGKEGKAYPLPPNFTEKASAAYIDYRLVVTIRRGVFRVNQTLSTNFAYIPKIVPGVPSELRRLAYDEEMPLFSPDGDPDGWEVLAPVLVKGTLSEVTEVEVECTLAIAKPLCYAPGSPLPLYLTMKSGSVQALDLLSSPDAVRLHLVRSLGIAPDAAETTTIGRTDNLFLSDSGHAMFWESGKQEQHTRKLEGEIEVSNTLKPSFLFPRFTVKYRLDLLPFTATGFRLTNSGAILLSQEVAIATQQTPGILPRSTIPPGYKRSEQVDYNKAVGFLENGNQRFWHHGRG